MSADLHAYYLTQENGERLLEGIQVLRPTARTGAKYPSSGKPSSGSGSGSGVRKKKAGGAKKGGEPSSVVSRNRRGGTEALGRRTESSALAASDSAPSVSSPAVRSSSLARNGRKKRKSLDLAVAAPSTATATEERSKSVGGGSATSNKSAKSKRAISLPEKGQGTLNDEESVGVSTWSLGGVESGSEGKHDFGEGGRLTAALCARVSGKGVRIGKVRRKHKRRRKLAVPDEEPREQPADDRVQESMEAGTEWRDNGGGEASPVAVAVAATNSKRQKRKEQEVLSQEAEHDAGAGSDDSASTDLEQPWRELPDGPDSAKHEKRRPLSSARKRIPDTDVDTDDTDDNHRPRPVSTDTNDGSRFLPRPDGNGDPGSTGSDADRDAVIEQGDRLDARRGGDSDGRGNNEENSVSPHPRTPASPINDSMAAPPAVADLTAVAVVRMDSNRNGRRDGGGGGVSQGVHVGNGDGEHWVSSLAPVSEQAAAVAETSPPRLTISADDEDDHGTQAENRRNGGGRQGPTSAPPGRGREESARRMGVVSGSEDSERGRKADVEVVKDRVIRNSKAYGDELGAAGGGGGGSGSSGGSGGGTAASAATGKATVVPVLSSSASDPHELEVAHLLISGLGMMG